MQVCLFVKEFWSIFEYILHRHNIFSWGMHTFRAICAHDPYVYMNRLIEKFLILLWLTDAIWQQRSGPTLAQIIACCVTASSQYQNQRWRIGDLGAFPRTAEDIISKTRLQITFSKMHSDFPGANELNRYFCCSIVAGNLISLQVCLLIAQGPLTLSSLHTE